MLAVVAYPDLAECGFHLAVIKVLRMSSRTGNLLIAVGAVALVLGLITLPAALGEHIDTSLLTLGAAGIYSRFHDRGDRLLPESPRAGFAGSLQERLRQNPKTHSDGSAVAVMYATVTCRSYIARYTRSIFAPTAWPRHYDFRSCTYIPSTRASTPKSAKSMAKIQGA